MKWWERKKTKVEIIEEGKITEEGEIDIETKTIMNIITIIEEAEGTTMIVIIEATIMIEETIGCMKIIGMKNNLMNISIKGIKDLGTNHYKTKILIT